MNGIHDMGGMHGMGPIEHEKNELVFHARWEGRVYAMTRAFRAAPGRSNLDNSRHRLERILPAEYLRMSYYERWLTRLENQLVENGTVTRAELDGVAAPSLESKSAKSAKAAPAVTAAMVPAMVARRSSARRDVAVPARFKVGQHVRARNINPTGHTRLPRYARGKVGLVVRHHGVFVFPDSNAAFAGENPQNLYSVRFTARELWGVGASARDAIHLDMWDDYLDHA